MNNGEGLEDPASRSYGDMAFSVFCEHAVTVHASIACVGLLVRLVSAQMAASPRVGIISPCRVSPA